MKIGFVLDDGLDKPDGVQQYILTLGHWLRNEGHVVHYLVGETHRKDIHNLHSLGKNINLSFNGNNVSIPYKSNKAKIKSILSKERFDVLHVQMPYSPVISGKVIKYAPKTTAVIGTFHIVPYSFKEKLGTSSLRIIERKGLKRFDKIFAVSPPAARFAKKSLGVKSIVLPNVVSYHLFSESKKISKFQDGKINLIFLGRLVERKGCMHLLKAIKLLHDQKSLLNVRILICGKGPQSSALRKYVDDNHLGSMVHFVGFISEIKKGDYLKSANIAVFPSTGGESFGIVLVEAMSAGTEVVLAGNNSGYKSVMHDLPEQLFVPSDTSALAKKIKHFIVNARARRHSALMQQKVAAKYDVHNVGPKILKEYKLAVAKRVNNKHN